MFVFSLFRLELVEAHTLVLTASVDSSVRVWTFEGDYIGRMC